MVEKKKATKKKSVKKESEKKGKSFLERTIGFFAWLTGVIVSLAVGFGMVSENLFVGPAANDLWIPVSITVFFGWVVVITTLLSVLLAIVHKLQK